jgi:predicted MFS family arabinose efflux permease
VALPLEGLGSAASFLLISGAARAAARWVAGVVGDRRPSRLVLAAGMALALGGLIVLALSTSTAAVLIAAVAYGAGYGAAQTAAFLVMSERGTRQDSGAISALWNGGIDLGSSLGGSLVGLTAAHYGYGAAAWVLPVAVAIAVPLTVWPAPAAVSKQAEYRI